MAVSSMPQPPVARRSPRRAAPVTARDTCAMSKVPAVILLALTLALALAGAALRPAEAEAAVTEAQCRQMPTKNKHCHLEYGTWQRESDHVVRYVFDWGGRRCVAWRWWTDPARCPLPVDENNFPSERACLAACSGWA